MEELFMLCPCTKVIASLKQSHSKH